MNLSFKSLSLLLTLASLPLLATSSIGENKQNSGLSDLPFMKSVNFCLLACTDAPVDMVTEFTNKLIAFRQAETKIPAMKDQKKARRDFTKTVEYTLFKDKAQFNLAYQEIVKATNERTANPMKDLLRDSRITFKPEAKKVITVKADGTIRRSLAYDLIKKAAMEYFKQRELVGKDPNFKAWDDARVTLEISMKKFLKAQFEDLAELNAFYTKKSENLKAFLIGQLNGPNE